jgi:hypothetical protein
MLALYVDSTRHHHVPLLTVRLLTLFLQPLYLRPRLISLLFQCLHVRLQFATLHQRTLHHLIIGHDVLVEQVQENVGLDERASDGVDGGEIGVGHCLVDCSGVREVVVELTDCSNAVDVAS